MTDRRGAMRAEYGQWLRVRANVRALATSLAAAEFALQRAARRTDDPDAEMLHAQLRAQRAAFDELGRDLDQRIAEVKGECAAIEAQHVGLLSAAARTIPRHPARSPGFSG